MARQIPVNILMSLDNKYSCNLVSNLTLGQRNLQDFMYSFTFLDSFGQKSNSGENSLNKLSMYSIGPA